MSDKQRNSRGCDRPHMGAVPQNLSKSWSEWVIYQQSLTNHAPPKSLFFILFDLEMAHEFSLLTILHGVYLYFVLSQSFLLPSFLRENEHLMLTKILAYKAALRVSMLHLCWHYLLISKLFAKAYAQVNIFLGVNMCTSWLKSCSFKKLQLVPL